MLQYFWLALVPPLAGFLLNGILGRKLPSRLISCISCFATGGSFLIVIPTFFALIQLPSEQRVIVYQLFTWIQTGTFTAECSFLLDPLSMIMMLVITGVGLLIHLYSAIYMAKETGLYRYFSYLNLFVFMMLLLVIAGNYLLLFVGWEGVGLCSYLLIGYYFERKSAGDAAKKAFVVNRVGDACFLLGIFLLFGTFGNIEFVPLFEAINQGYPESESGLTALSVTGLLLFLGAAGKSAQFPLQIWLPDAMEGPTPVSALIHAATMVTAGVYLIVRSAAIYSRIPEVLFLIAVVGMLTALMAALAAIVQRDIKKVLAYSTISQLGYMFMALGVGSFGAGIFHLITHAFFKALLFLGSGSILLCLHHKMDLFQMGGLKNSLRVTFWTMWIATLSLSGIPPFAGFFSKDEILWNVLTSPLGHPVFWVVGLIVAGLTSFYICRLMILAFHGSVSDSVQKSDPESRSAVTVPLVLLALAAAVSGFLGLPTYLGTHQLQHFLDPVFQFSYSHQPANLHGNPHTLELLTTALAVSVSLLGLFLAYRFYYMDKLFAHRLAQQLPRLHLTLLNQFWIDRAYSLIIVGNLKYLSRKVLWKTIDVGLIDRSVNGLAATFKCWSDVVRQMQTGKTRTYAAWILTGTASIFLYFFLVVWS